jgi:hypothetical protein
MVLSFDMVSTTNASMVLYVARLAFNIEESRKPIEESQKAIEESKKPLKKVESH